MEGAGLIMTAINEIERELFTNEDLKSQQVGILKQALNHIYKNVYRVEITV